MRQEVASLEPDGPGVAGASREERLGKLRAPRADEAGEAHDLSGPDIEGDVAKPVPRGGVSFRGEDDVPGPAGELRVLFFHVARDHQPDQVGLFRSGRVDRRDIAAVAQHGDPVAQRQDLFEVVGDIEDREPLPLQLANEREQDLALPHAQGRGRLVEDDDLRVPE